MEERESARFSVDELAERADVSRRTVFNHFASLDEVVVMAAAEILSHIIDELAAQFGDDEPSDLSFLEQMAAVTRANQVVPIMARLVRLLGGEGSELSHHEVDLAQRAFAQLDERITDLIVCADNGLDSFPSQLIAVTFTAGVFHLFRRWSTATGAVDTPASRQLWDELLTQLVELLRDGESRTHASAIRIPNTAARPPRKESETL